MVITAIWDLRNQIVHEKIIPNLEHTICMIRIRWGMWIKAANKDLPYSVHETVNHLEIFNENVNKKEKMAAVTWLPPPDHVLKWNVDG